MSLQEIHRPEVDPASPCPEGAALPRRLLYSTAARIGGTGLDTSSLQGILASYRQGFLGLAIGYADQQTEIPPHLVQSLRFHPVRLLSALGSADYYGAKKHYVDWIASRRLARGGFDCFHSWTGDCERSLILARQRGIPSMIEIPTWHRNKGNVKPPETESERGARAASGLGALRSGLAVSRLRSLVEYELVDLVLVPSELAAASFLSVGFDPKRIFYVGRGCDPSQYTPATPTPQFRLIFVGALIKRKGVHLILEAWKKLNLKNAELVLVGSVHPEMEPYLKEFKTDSVRVEGFRGDVPRYLGNATAFVFPSELEGAAKATIEAAASALPLIATRESGDAVVDQVTGIVVPPNDVSALADAIRHLYDHPELCAEMGRAARQRVLDHFTWDHYRARLLRAYSCLISR